MCCFFSSFYFITLFLRFFPRLFMFSYFSYSLRCLVFVLFNYFNLFFYNVRFSNFFLPLHIILPSMFKFFSLLHTPCILVTPISVSSLFLSACESCNHFSLLFFFFSYSINFFLIKLCYFLLPLLYLL